METTKEELLKELEDLKSKGKILKDIYEKETAICDEEINILNDKINVINKNIKDIDKKHLKKLACVTPVFVCISGLFFVLFIKLFVLFGALYTTSVIASLFTTCILFLPLFAFYFYYQHNKNYNIVSFYIIEIYELYMKIHSYQLSKFNVKRNYDNICKLIIAKENEINSFDNVIPCRNKLENYFIDKSKPKKLVKNCN